MVNYQINGLSDPRMQLTYAGTVYFVNNLSSESYALQRVSCSGNTLLMEFRPNANLFGPLGERSHFMEDKPGFIAPLLPLQGTGHYLEVGPSEAFSLIIKEINAKNTATYYIVDTYGEEGSRRFRERKYVCYGYSGKDRIAYHANEKDPPEDGFELIDTVKFATNTEHVLYYHKDN